LKYIKYFFKNGLLYGHNNHSKVLYYSYVDWEESPFEKISISGYYVLIRDNLVSWKSNK